MASPKVVFIDHPYFAVKNKDNNYRFYKGKDSSGKRIYKQCKDKTEYAKEVKNYLFGNYAYANERKLMQTYKQKIALNAT